MTRNLSIGSSGSDVRDLQLSINHRPPSILPLLTADGIFGSKTDNRVKEFQKNNGLNADGIVGPKTRAVLSGDIPKNNNRGCDCCNPDPLTTSQVSAISSIFKSQQLQSSNRASFSPQRNSIVGAGILDSIRRLTAAQQTTASAVYGSSLDFSRIFISDKTGAGNRPFTVAIVDPVNVNISQVINCGTFEPKKDLLIHELAHVWQSQHHSDQLRFMQNAVQSQGEAIVKNLVAVSTDPFIFTNKNFPTFFPFDAYAYNPFASFNTLAAEQMAKAIENEEIGVVAHIKGIAKNAIDPDCVLALAKPGTADRRIPGIK